MTGKLIVDNFVKAVEERPGDFHQGLYTLTDKRSGIEYWTDMGFFHYGVWRPMEYKFSLWQQYRFARAFKRLKETQALMAQTNGG